MTAQFNTTTKTPLPTGQTLLTDPGSAAIYDDNVSDTTVVCNKFS